MPKRNVPGDIRLRFGQRIRRLRTARGWGQAELAAESGISRENISRLENGHIEPTFASLEALAGTFDMTISQLMRGI